MFTVPAIDMAATGRNIMRLREAAGMTVRELQDIFGFATPQAIYKWQHGTAMPTVDNLVVLAAVLEVSLDEIIVINVKRSFSRSKRRKAFARRSGRRPFGLQILQYHGGKIPFAPNSLKLWAGKPSGEGGGL